jgi:hypothetical protein
VAKPIPAGAARRPRRRFNALAGAVGAIGLAVSLPAAAEIEQGGTIASFDLPPQPLADALYAFSTATEVQVLVDARLIKGIWSRPVRGVLGREEALRRLLAGTGLEARYTTPTMFTLAVIPGGGGKGVVAAVSEPEAWPADVVREHERYSSAVQVAVARALCRDDDTRPGDYRIAVRLWIAPSGAVLRSALLGTTDDRARDGALSRKFGALRFERPPRLLPQPITLLILPRASADCAAMHAVETRDHHISGDPMPPAERVRN